MNLKAMNREEASDGVIISFNSKWEPELGLNRIQCVFRKRGPKHIKLKWIYVYIGAPSKLLAGRFSVKKMSVQSIDKCVQLAPKGAISADELREYAKSYDELFVFEVGAFEPTCKDVHYAKLKAKYNYCPPQSFLILSKQGQVELDALCGYK